MGQQLYETFMKLRDEREKLMSKRASDVVGNRVRLRDIREKEVLEEIKRVGVEHQCLSKYATSGQMIAQPLRLMESEVSLDRVIKAGRQAHEQFKAFTDNSQPTAEHYLAACRAGFVHDHCPPGLSVDHTHFCSKRPAVSDIVLDTIEEEWEASLSVAWDHLESGDLNLGHLIGEFQESQADDLEDAIEALTYMGNVTDYSYQVAADIAIDYYSNIDLITPPKEA